MIRVASFDLETTGVDPLTDRIVSAALVALEADGTILHTTRWTLNPGIPIPEEATAVHGISDRDVADAIPAPTGVEFIGSAVADALERGWPIVVFNAPFDLTMLSVELDRYGLPPLPPLQVVIDPLVLDKGIDKYRKGRRTLTATCEFYGVEFDGEAHGALADATAAGRLAQRILTEPALAKYGPAAIHAAQVTWAHEQATSFADYLRRNGKPFDDVRGDWPRWKDTP